jgi:hypothetical protein
LFVYPPYSAHWEINLGYTDYVRVHQEAAQWLESGPGQPRILTYWPATEELRRPIIGYVSRPLNVVETPEVTPGMILSAPPESYDMVYLYSAYWDPQESWLVKRALYRRMNQIFSRVGAMPEHELVARRGLKLRIELRRGKNWVRIYSK